ncbi:MAG: hypothetical protein WD824_15525 [Cyclobacteriaceae bacterium]
MKGLCFTLIFFLAVFAGFSQHAKNTLALTVSGNDRISVVKSSVRLAEWHEKSFWPLYEEYLGDAAKVYSLTYRSLQDLAETDKSTAGQEAFENGWKFLTYRNDELKLRKLYYQEVAAILNGVVALQFLQTESMMDMLESSQIYSKSNWNRFRFHSQSMPREKVNTAKHNTLASALALSQEEEVAFWQVYNKYEEESDALLGEAYSIYGLFASDASDFTPALAKRLGYDLLHVMDREIKLKERYFLEMNATVGSSVAARFLAWEDYYSLVSKMYAWVDAP